MASKLILNGTLDNVEGQVFSWSDGLGNNSARIYGTSSDELIFQTSSSNINRFHIGSDGHFYLDNNTLLRTSNGSVSSPSFSFDSDRDTGFYSGGSNIIVVSTNATEHMRIDSVGHVTITGSVSANNLLQLYEPSSDSSFMRITNATTGTTTTGNPGTSTGDGLDIGYDSAEAAYVWNHENTNLILGTNNTTKMVIGPTDVSFNSSPITDYTEKLTTSSGTSFAVNPSTSPTWKLTFTNATPTITMSTVTTGRTYNVVVVTVTGATNTNINWSANVKWTGGTEAEPTVTSGATDIYSLFTVDGGTNWYAFQAGKGMA